MPAIITDKFRIHNSEQFKEAFSETSGNTMYLGIGRPQAFATSTRADSRTNNEGSDTAPVTPADNTNAQKNTINTASAYYKQNKIDVEVGVDSTNNTTVNYELRNGWTKQKNLSKFYIQPFYFFLGKLLQLTVFVFLLQIILPHSHQSWFYIHFLNF